MNDFLLLIRAKGDPMAKLPKDKQKAHIKQIGDFLESLKLGDVLKAAQPLKPQGAIVSKSDDKLVHVSIDKERELIAGYYLIQAATLDDAIKIAKSDPRFESGNWKIEVRPIMKLDGINE